MRIPVLGLSPGLMVLVAMGYLSMKVFTTVARIAFSLTMVVLAITLIVIDTVCRIIVGTPLELSEYAEMVKE